MDSLDNWQLSTGLNGISTNSINELFQMIASTEYSWLQCGFPEDADKDNDATQHYMLSKLAAGAEIRTCPNSPQLFLVLQTFFIKGILLWKLLTVQYIPLFSFC